MTAPKILSGIPRDEVDLVLLKERGLSEALSEGGSAGRKGRANFLLLCLLNIGMSFRADEEKNYVCLCGLLL